MKEHFGTLITDDEINILIANCKASKIDSYYDYWIPIQWSTRILSDAKEVSFLSASALNQMRYMV